MTKLDEFIAFFEKSGASRILANIEDEGLDIYSDYMQDASKDSYSFSRLPRRLFIGERAWFGKARKALRAYLNNQKEARKILVGYIPFEMAKDIVKNIREELGVSGYRVVPGIDGHFANFPWEEELKMREGDLPAFASGPIEPIKEKWDVRKKEDLGDLFE